MLIWILLGIALIIALAWSIYWYNSESDKKEAIQVFIFSFIFLRFFAVAIYFAGMEIAISNTSNIEEYTVEKCKISGLETKQDETKKLEGTFILGCGSIKGISAKTIKYYFVSNNELGKKIENTTTNNVYIKESSDDVPNYKLIYTRKSLSGILKILFGENKKEELIGEVLTVPENTVKINYEVSL